MSVFRHLLSVLNISRSGQAQDNQLMRKVSGLYITYGCVALLLFSSLCWFVLICLALVGVALCCLVLLRVPMCCFPLHCSAAHCVALLQFALICQTLRCSALLRIVLFQSTLLYIAMICFAFNCSALLCFAMCVLRTYLALLCLVGVGAVQGTQPQKPGEQGPRARGTWPASSPRGTRLWECSVQYTGS